MKDLGQNEASAENLGLLDGGTAGVGADLALYDGHSHAHRSVVGALYPIPGAVFHGAEPHLAPPLGQPADLSNLQLAHWICNRQKSDLVAKQGTPPPEAKGPISNRVLPLSFNWEEYRPK